MTASPRSAADGAAALIGQQPVGRVPAGTMLAPAMFADELPLGADEVVVGAALDPGEAPLSVLEVGAAVELLRWSSAIRAECGRPIAGRARRTPAESSADPIGTGTVWAVEPVATGQLWVSVRVDRDVGLAASWRRPLDRAAHRARRRASRDDHRRRLGRRFARRDAAGARAGRGVAGHGAPPSRRRGRPRRRPARCRARGRRRAGPDGAGARRPHGGADDRRRRRTRARPRSATGTSSRPRRRPSRRTRRSSTPHRPLAAVMAGDDPRPSGSSTPAACTARSPALPFAAVGRAHLLVVTPARSRAAAAPAPRRRPADGRLPRRRSSSSSRRRGRRRRSPSSSAPTSWRCCRWVAARAGRRRRCAARAWRPWWRARRGRRPLPGRRRDVGDRPGRPDERTGHARECHAPKPSRLEEVIEAVQEALVTAEAGADGRRWDDLEREAFAHDVAYLVRRPSGARGHRGRAPRRWTSPPRTTSSAGPSPPTSTPASSRPSSTSTASPTSWSTPTTPSGCNTSTARLERYGEPIFADADDLRDEVAHLARRAGGTERRFDDAKPMLVLRLPDGSRLAAIMNVSTVPQVAIRRNVLPDASLDELEERGTIDRAMHSLLPRRCAPGCAWSSPARRAPARRRWCGR